MGDEHTMFDARSREKMIDLFDRLAKLTIILCTENNRKLWTKLSLKCDSFHRTPLISLMRQNYKASVSTKGGKNAFFSKLFYLVIAGGQGVCDKWDWLYYNHWSNGVSNQPNIGSKTLRTYANILRPNDDAEGSFNLRRIADALRSKGDLQNAMDEILKSQRTTFTADDKKHFEAKANAVIRRLRKNAQADLRGRLEEVCIHLEEVLKQMTD